MRVFFVGEFSIYSDIEKEKMLRDWGVKDRLISYEFLKSRDKPYFDVFKKVIEKKVYDGVMIDSGAYSVAVKGAKIDEAEYTEFCSEFGADFYFSLDTIPYVRKMVVKRQDLFEWSAKETERNYEYMRSKGIEVIPTFHSGEDFYYLEKMSKEFPMIALSATSQRMTKISRIRRYLDECFRIIPDTCRVHGLSVTDRLLPCIYPWYSVDSAAWVKHAYSGTIKIILPEYYTKGEEKYTTLAVCTGDTPKMKKERDEEDRSSIFSYYQGFHTSCTNHYLIVGKEYRKEIDKYLDSVGSSYEKCRDDMYERLRVNVLYYKKSLFRNLKISEGVQNSLW